MKKTLENWHFLSVAELPETAYKLDPNEIKKLYQSSVERRQNLENRQVIKKKKERLVVINLTMHRPLKTQKMRDGEDQEKLKKYPKTTIRIRMPDHTIVQAVFQTKERGNKHWKWPTCKAHPFIVSALYEFTRSLLETPERKFVLCLPPRTKLTEPSLTFFKAGLSPASNVLFAWVEQGEKGKNLRAETYMRGNVVLNMSKKIRKQWFKTRIFGFKTSFSSTSNNYFI